MKTGGPRKAKSAKRNASIKRTSATKRSARNIGSPRGPGTLKNFDEYLATIPEPARMPLILMREAISSVVPAGAVEVISYGIPAFKLNKMLVWYGGFAGHCSLYPTAAVLDAFKDELRGYTTSKGTVQFPLARPMPMVLIKKLVRARVADLNR